jgi:prepilin-type N-terminal cleavage/methylation domain-containing protein
MKADNNKGFTLIELLIVIAIIAVLVAIAVPAYLGQRDKARIESLKASAKGAVAETQAVLDAYHSAHPYILLDTNGNDVCKQASYIVSHKTCNAVYNRADSGDPYTNINDIIQSIIDHHEGKKELSPFDGGQDLYVSTAGTPGTIVLDSINSRAIRIRAFALGASPIFEDTVR